MWLDSIVLEFDNKLKYQVAKQVIQNWGYAIEDYSEITPNSNYFCFQVYGCCGWDDRLEDIYTKLVNIINNVYCVAEEEYW